MKRTVKLMTVAIAAMVIGAQPACAQFGKLLKKAQDAVNTVTNATDQTSTVADGEAVVTLDNMQQGALRHVTAQFEVYNFPV